MRSAERLSQAASPLAGLLKAGVILLAVAAMGWAAALMIAPDMRPLLALLVVGALAGLWVLVTGLDLRRTLALLLVLLILTPAVRIAPGLPVIYGDEVLIFIVGTLLLLTGLVRRGARSPWRLGLAGFSLFLFLPWTLVTMLSGLVVFDIPITRGDAFELVKFAKYVMAFYVASHVSLRPGDLRLFSTILVVVVVLSALIGLLQAFNIGDIRRFSLDVIFGAFKRPDVEPARSKLASILLTRAAGTVGNPNNFGMVIALSLAMAGSLVWTRALRARALLALYGAFGILGASLIVAASRTAFVAVLVSGAYLAWVLLREREAGTRRRGLDPRLGRLVLAAAGIVLVVAVPLAAGVGGGGVKSAIARGWERVVAPFSSEEGFQEFPIQRRLDMIARGLQEAAGSPILGYGSAEGAPWLLAGGTPESDVVKVLLRMGIVGLLIFAVFWLAAFRLARSLWRSPDEETRRFGQAVCAVIVLDLVAALTMDSLYDIRRMTLTCILLGLCLAARARMRAQDAVQQRDGVPSDGVTQLRRLHAR